MRALKINEGTNDLVMENGNFVWVEGKDELVQEIASVAKTVLGEWFLNPAHGIGYFNILGQKYDKELAIQVLFDGITQVDRVEQVESLDVDYDNKTREIKMDYVVIADGIRIEGSEVF